MVSLITSCEQPNQLIISPQCERGITARQKREPTAVLSRFQWERSWAAAEYDPCLADLEARWQRSAAKNYACSLHMRPLT
ncbi:hypothetical protein V2G26_011440 [Clonostachys chloroleuca]